MAASPIATAADYADAMMTARGVKNALILVLMLLLLGHVGIFCALRYSHLLPDATTSTAATTATPAAAQPAGSNAHALVALRDLTNVIDFLGIALAILLSLVLLLVVNIMLVGRLIGVARLTSAYCWCLLLALLLFPWQSFLQNPAPPAAPASAQTADAASPAAAPKMNVDLKIPGVLYTWSEVTHPVKGAKFTTAGYHEAALHWARYIAWPTVAIIILLVVQAKSSRGLKQALGEAEIETHEGLPA